MKPRTIALLLALLYIPILAHAKSRPIRLRSPRLVVPARGETELWTAFRIPRDTPLDIAGFVVKNRGANATVASHHARVYAGASESVTVSGRRLLHRWSGSFGHYGEAMLIGGAQSAEKKLLLDPGLALRVQPVVPPGRRSKRKEVWVFLDSHWINGSNADRGVHVELTLILAPPHTVKRTLQPIFEVAANVGLSVAPHTIRSTEDSTTSVNAVLAGLNAAPLVDAWGPGVNVDLLRASSAQETPMPSGPVCLYYLTAHMHKRGRLFGVDFIESDGPVRNGAPESTPENPFEPGRHHLFVSRLWEDPADYFFRPGRLISPGQRIHYACWEDNGVTTRVRYSCGVAGGTAPGATLLAQSLFSDYPPSSCSQPQENSSECASESAVGGPDCVEANLTFGQGAADDEMCILPGAYYEPNFGAPAGHECDLALLTPID